MNPWRRGPVTQNPYYRTAFRVTRVPREITRHSTVVKMIGQTRNVVESDLSNHGIAGEPVTMAELNAAEKVILNAVSRLHEELLHHAAEPSPFGQLRKLALEVEKQLANPETPPLSISRPAVFRPLAEHVLGLALESLPKPDPSFGARELGMPPPFAPSED